MRWLIYSLILRYPKVCICLLVILVIGAFSVMMGWPAYVFLGICVLMLIASLLINGKTKKLSNISISDVELDQIERKNRWLMGILSVFALSGIIVSMHLTLSTLKYDKETSSIIGAMALFHFCLIGIPYILMYMVKRRHSFWYGIMTPLLLAAIIQFFICSLLANSNDIIITKYTLGGFKRVGGNWIIVLPLLFIPITMFLDSLGKAFGFKVKDNTIDVGYDKEKNKNSIVINKKLSAISMALSFIWSVLSLLYCYFYLNSLREALKTGI